MHFINNIINIFYPNVCGICDKITQYDICPKCLRKLNNLKQCKKHIYLKRNFTTHLYIFKYEDIIRDKIIKYKFCDQAYRYKGFAKFLQKDKKICGFFKKYDIIIPVPISKIRNRKRGYNQSELIIRELSKTSTNIHVLTNVLYKQKNTLPQSSLDKLKRQNNLKGAYKVENSEMIKNKKILLFDDIYTTGSTLDECARVLKLAGAKEVGALTLAKD